MTDKVHWPDGTKGSRPSDGYIYTDSLGTYWQWDDFLGMWSRGYGGSSPGSPGDVLNIEPVEQVKKEAPKCTCGSAIVGLPGHSHYCDLNELVTK